MVIASRHTYSSWSVHQPYSSGFTTHNVPLFVLEPCLHIPNRVQTEYYTDPIEFKQNSQVYTDPIEFKLNRQVYTDPIEFKLNSRVYTDPIEFKQNSQGFRPNKCSDCISYTNTDPIEFKHKSGQYRPNRVQTE